MPSRVQAVSHRSRRRRPTRSPPIQRDARSGSPFHTPLAVSPACIGSLTSCSQPISPVTPPRKRPGCSAATPASSRWRGSSTHIPRVAQGATRRPPRDRRRHVSSLAKALPIHRCGDTSGPLKCHSASFHSGSAATTAHSIALSTTPTLFADSGASPMARPRSTPAGRFVSVTRPHGYWLRTKQLQPA